MKLAQQLTVRLTESPWWQRWQRLEPRERLSLSLLAAFLLVTLCYLLLWQPAQQRVGEARAWLQQERELYGYLQQNTELARQMSRSNVVTLAPEQLQGLVTQSAQQQGLVIESFDNSSDGNLQVSLPAASYAVLLRWFDELQAAGAGLAEVSLSRVGEGLVDARVTFRANG
ncbi:MAG TPA: type II secretion system protein M [Pseudomonas sp.]|uniref:type II secretion system protein M n=1 Tax=Stutzerimonas nitrititolerans TaxID=2482751 RepID=UPI000EEDA577|nr:type II secretion system protein M [Stutzerimonas nitrititolerans]HAQ26735.1 type II secretion system protein M [Pseudomonas sp.]